MGARPTDSQTRPQQRAHRAERDRTAGNSPTAESNPRPLEASPLREQPFTGTRSYYESSPRVRARPTERVQRPIAEAPEAEAHLPTGERPNSGSESHPRGSATGVGLATEGGPATGKLRLREQVPSTEVHSAAGIQRQKRTRQRSNHGSEARQREKAPAGSSPAAGGRSGNRRKSDSGSKSGNRRKSGNGRKAQLRKPGFGCGRRVRQREEGLTTEAGGPGAKPSGRVWGCTPQNEKDEGKKRALFARSVPSFPSGQGRDRTGDLPLFSQAQNRSSDSNFHGPCPQRALAFPGPFSA